MSVIALLSIVRRYWQLGLIGLALCFAGLMYVGKLRAERSLEHCRGQLGSANLLIETQNRAIDQMHREGEKRALEQQANLRRVRQENQAQQSTIERLRRSANVPRSGPCTISEALREAEGSL